MDQTVGELTKDLVLARLNKSRSLATAETTSKLCLAISGFSPSLGAPPLAGYYSALILSAIATYLAWEHANVRGTAEALKRQYELHTGLGVRLDPGELASHQAGTWFEPSGDESGRGESLGMVYASTEQASYGRLAENLHESSWWSARLATYNMRFQAVLAVLWGIALLISIPIFVPANATVPGLGEFLVQLIVFTFAVEAARKAASYASFRGTSAEVNRQVEQLLRQRPLDETKLLMRLGQYQAARGGTPLLATWIWKLSRDRLNPIYRSLRARILPPAPAPVGGGPVASVRQQVSP